MVKRYKASRSLTASDNCSGGSGSYKDSEQVYCVVLHVVEGNNVYSTYFLCQELMYVPYAAINFVGRDSSERDREKIVMNAALNTVDFEVEGTQSSTAETIIFNSNCIWECDMAGIKRIKTDHRPVKVTFYACRGGGLERKTIGSLLLPVRGLPVLSSPGSHNASQLKMFWHKLICISSEFRSHKPEVLLILAIIKKSILHTKDFDHLMQFADVSTASVDCVIQGDNIFLIAEQVAAHTADAIARSLNHFQHAPVAGEWWISDLWRINFHVPTLGQCLCAVLGATGSAASGQ